MDDAFHRSELLASLVERARSQALGQPQSEGNIALGIIQRGDRPEEARRKVEQRFADLARHVERAAVLDMAGAFESLFRGRLATAVGEARKILREREGRPVRPFPFWADREGLVQEITSFAGLAAATSFIRHHLSHESRETLAKIVTVRNEYAHGVARRTAPPVTRQQIRDVLNALIAYC